MDLTLAAAWHKQLNAFFRALAALDCRPLATAKACHGVAGKPTMSATSLKIRPESMKQTVQYQVIPSPRPGERDREFHRERETLHFFSHHYNAPAHSCSDHSHGMHVIGCTPLYTTPPRASKRS